MILFCIFIQSLLYKCFADIVIVTGRFDELTDLNDVMKCDSWQFDGRGVAMPLNVSAESEGVYKCATSNNKILFLVYEILEFSVVPELGLTTDDNITMSCTLSSLFKTFNITNKITIFDHTGSVLKVGDGQEEIPELERVYTATSLTFIPDKSGKVTYKCLWNYDVEYEGVHYNGSLQKNLALRIYVTVRDARPDKYTVDVDENVTCSADGDPIPTEFNWVCDPYDEDKDGWKATGEVIVFTHAKEYSCKCVASHLIYIRVHHAVWNGTIVVKPGEGSETGGGKGKPGGKSPGGKSPGGKPPTKGGDEKVPGGKKDKDVTNTNAENEEEDYEDEGGTESKPKDQRRPSGSDANSLRAIVALALLTPCFVVMATK